MLDNVCLAPTWWIKHKVNQQLLRTSPLPSPHIWRPQAEGCSYPACSTASSTWGRQIRRSKRQNRWEVTLQCQWVSPSEDSSPPRLKCREAEQKSALFSTGSQNLKICLRADSKLFLSCKIRKLTCCSNTIKPNKSIETGCSTRQDSREAERHETTNTQTLWLQLGCTENTKQD